MEKQNMERSSKETDEFVLPERYKVLRNESNYKIINEYATLTSLNQAGVYYRKEGFVYFNRYKVDPNGNTFYKEITFEQFTKYILKQDSMENEIIGYKCPVDLFNGNIKKDWILFKDSDGNTYRPKGQGPLHALPKEIVETWEPVYKEENFKVGDYITVIGNVKGGWLECTNIRTFKITREKTRYYNGEYFGVSGDCYTNAGLYTEFRLATQEEIEIAKRPNITINGYK